MEMAAIFYCYALVPLGITGQRILCIQLVECCLPPGSWLIAVPNGMDRTPHALERTAGNMPLMHLSLPPSLPLTRHPPPHGALPPSRCSPPTPPKRGTTKPTNKSVAPFPLFEVQANAVAAAISGRGRLPRLAEREQWLLDEEKGLRERSVDPASRGAHVLGDLQWSYLRRLFRLAAGPGCVSRGPPRSADAAACEGAVEDDPEAVLQDLLENMSVREALWNDVGDCRPQFPGGPDDYRRREYHVDWATGDFSVSYNARKANGEGPAVCCQTNDLRRVKDLRQLNDLEQPEGLRQRSDGPCA